MQIRTRPRLDRINAALDTLRLMLVRLAAALLDACAADTAVRRWLKRRVAADLAARLYDFKCQMVLLAFATRITVPVEEGPRGGHRPWNGRPRYAPTGFRRSRCRGSGLRHGTRALVRRLKRGSLSARVDALSRALADVDAWLDDLVVRLEAFEPFARLTPVSPAAQNLIFCEDFGAVAAPDSS